MTERRKLGVRVDAEVVEAFKEDVKRRKGQVRGVFGDEVETAMRQYLSENKDVDDSERLRRIEDRLSRMEANMGTVTADGGADTSEGGGHTHAPSRVESARDEKPPANSATEKKVEYLAGCVLERQGSESVDEVPRDHIIKVVKDEYGFRSDTAKRYVSEVADRLELEPHPSTDSLFVSDRQREKIVKRLNRQRSADADQQFEEMEQ